MDQMNHLESLQSISAFVIYGLLGLYALHQLLVYFDFSILSPQELFWNSAVYLIPTPLLLSASRRQELSANKMLSQRHAAKSEALRSILGWGGNGILHNLPDASKAIGMGNIIRRASMLAGAQRPIMSDAPSGLGNWDNSCYQNSVLQALTSVSSLRSWLGVLQVEEDDAPATTGSSLQETIVKLRDPVNNGTHIWTPAKLKNMSSWQQQDAQEYFSKILEELDKEAAKKVAASETRSGLELITQVVLEDESSRKDGEKNDRRNALFRNPLEGLVAQRVTCTQCGFSEGFSMIPFNCLTVPLGSSFTYDLSDCLDEYTKREEIEGVECRRCTLVGTKQRLEQLSPAVSADLDSSEPKPTQPTLSLPPELRCQIASRIKAIEQALANDDFSDKTIKEKCQIPPKSFISSTKVREAVVGRAPQTLVIHINRSVFDEMTGMQRKNYAQVRYPMMLDLQPWMLQLGNSPACYRLKAAVTHYGRHENGHYICYRQHPRVNPLSDDDTDAAVKNEHEGWWRLSDEDVSAVKEEDVLNQGGAFMLFYERNDTLQFPDELAEAAAVPLPEDAITDFDEATAVQDLPEPLSRTVSESNAPSVVTESDADTEEDLQERQDAFVRPLPQTPLLRTASPQVVKHEFGMKRPLMSV